MSALVIAAHAPRSEAGRRAARALLARVTRMLPEVDVRGGYVEPGEPSVTQAVADALRADPDRHAVVMPLMTGACAHVREDIPAGIDAAIASVGGSASCTRPLGAGPTMRGAASRRIVEALGEWDAAETAVLLLGRGSTVIDANADHVRLARVLWEENGFGDMEAAFVPVGRPDLPTALDNLHARGRRRIVVMPHFLLPDPCEIQTHRTVEAWTSRHPDTEVRVANVIGDCDALASVVVERYRQALAERMGGAGPTPVYLSGLALQGRRVLVAGGGVVAARRVGKLLEAGAQVHVVAPEAGERVRHLAQAGQVEWSARRVEEADLDGVWYALALTDVAGVNAQVAAWAERRRVFCVRGDDARSGTAWTPATGRAGEFTIGVIGQRNPRRTVAARAAAVAAVTEMPTPGESGRPEGADGGVQADAPP